MILINLNCSITLFTQAFFPLAAIFYAMFKRTPSLFITVQASITLYFKYSCFNRNIYFLHLKVILANWTIISILTYTFWSGQ